MSEKFDFYNFRFTISEYIFMYTIQMVLFFILTVYFLHGKVLPYIQYILLFNTWILPLILIYFLRYFFYKKNNYHIEKLEIVNKKIKLPRLYKNKIISKSDIKDIYLVSNFAIISGFLGLGYLISEFYKSKYFYDKIIFNLKNGENIEFNRRNLEIEYFCKELYYIYFEDLFIKKRKFCFWG